MRYRNNHRKKHNRIIARHHINTLLDKAETTALQGDFQTANRYVNLARKIGMRYLLSIPFKHRRRICKKCYAYLLPGENMHVRLSQRKISITCHVCNHITRIPMSHRSDKN